MPAEIQKFHNDWSSYLEYVDPSEVLYDFAFSKPIDLPSSRYHQFFMGRDVAQEVHIGYWRLMELVILSYTTDNSQ